MGNIFGEYEGRFVFEDTAQKWEEIDLLERWESLMYWVKDAINDYTYESMMAEINCIEQEIERRDEEAGK